MTNMRSFSDNQTSSREMLSVKCEIYREADLVTAFLRSLRLAKAESRIRLGLKDSLKILEIDASGVIMCVISVSSEKQDPLAHLQLMLIEAFCNENGIRLLKVLSPEVLKDLLRPAIATDDDESMEDETEFDTSLVTIQASQMDHVEDDELRKIYDMACLHHNARPIIRLPS